MSSVTTAHNLFVDYEEIVREIDTAAQIGHPFIGEDAAGLPFPEIHKAVWDTGAMGTSISENLVSLYKLKPSGQMDIQGVTGRSTCSTYLISLFLPGNVVFGEIEVSSFSVDIGCDVLIGMDVIGQGDFAICNKANRTTFSFRHPSLDYINFTKQRPRDMRGLETIPD